MCFQSVPLIFLSSVYIYIFYLIFCLCNISSIARRETVTQAFHCQLTAKCNWCAHDNKVLNLESL